MRNSFIENEEDQDDVKLLDPTPSSPPPFVSLPGLSTTARKRPSSSAFSDSVIETDDPAAKKPVSQQLLHPIDEAIEKKKLGEHTKNTTSQYQDALKISW